MKKIITISSALMIAITASAQGNFYVLNDRDFDRDVVQIGGTLTGIFLITSFILSFIRVVLDSRVKRRMIEKGVSENIVEQFLQPTKTDGKSTAIKWFFVLASIGLGLTIINLTLPVGIHSIAIMAFSIALSFLGYFYYMKRSENTNA
jgi:hypothetical protein